MAALARELVAPAGDEARLPNFFLVGANKGGTTSLVQYLSKHPQVFMPAVKEPHYFTLSTRRVNNLPWRHQLVDTWKGYTALFEPAGDALAVGEASTAYLTTAEAPISIHQVCPDARIVAVLRNPVERAYSHFQMYRRVGVEASPDFEGALAGPHGHLYLGLGMYGAGLKRYLDLFPRANIRVYRQEQLRDDPDRLLADLFGFLGVDTSIRVDTSFRFNVSERVPQLNDMMSSRTPAVRALKRLLPKPARARLRIILQDLNRQPLHIRRQTRRLLADHYREDLALLDRLTGESYSAWLES